MKHNVKLIAIDIGSRHWPVRQEHIRLDCDVQVDVDESHETPAAAIKAAGWERLADNASCEWAMPAVAGLDRKVYTDAVNLYLDREYMTTKPEYTVDQVQRLVA